MDETIALMYEQMSLDWEGIDEFMNSVEGEPGARTEEVWGKGWASSKRDIFELWGNRLRVERTISPSYHEGLVDETVSGMFRELRRNIDSDSLGIIKTVFSRLSPIEIAKNQLEKGWLGYNRGTKTSRATGSLLECEKDRNHFHIAFSRVIQACRTEGKVVLSIDPIDILTMGIGYDGGWSTCQDIFAGENRAGVISHMFDESTFVAYSYRSSYQSQFLTHERPRLPRKIWRQLGIVGEDRESILLSDHYPHVNIGYENIVADLLRELFSRRFLSVSVDADDVEVHDIGEFHYNDITMSSKEGHRTTLLRHVHSEKTEFFVGSDRVPSDNGSGVICDSYYIRN